MKILHVTASYKPAFIYGGPIYSVAALCEAVEARSEKLKAESVNEVESKKYKVKSGSGLRGNLNAINNLPRTADYGQNTTTIQVYTTLANGKEELPYQNGESKIVDGVKVTYFKRLTKDHSHLSPALLSHLWENVKYYDAVHIHSWWNLVSMGAVIICLCRGVKPIVSPRGMLGDYTMSKAKTLFHRFIGKPLLRKCDFHATTAMEADEVLKQVFDGIDDVVVDLMAGESVKNKEERIKRKEQAVQCKNQKSSLNSAPSPSERVGVRRIFIIHNLVKLPEKLPVKTRVFDGTLNLIFLSRIHHKKGIELLLETLALVDFPFKLSIVGDGDLEYVESLKLKVESLKLTAFVNWVGAVYGDDKYQLLANHDAFVLPSYNENFANVVIEAIAVGVPVLLSGKVGLKDYVQEHGFGIVFKLEELKASLEKTYALFAENKLYFNNGLSKIQEPLTVKYLEMYAEASNRQS